MNLLRSIPFMLVAALSLQAQGLEDHFVPDMVRQELLDAVDLWNGGLDGQSGLGAYQTSWDGLFRTDLSRDFQQTNPTADQSVISQSRAIYMNVEAFRVAEAGDKARYLAVVQKGADYLVEHSWDPIYGGVFWGLEANGSQPPSDTRKQAYGQVHVIFSLCHAYAITGDSDHLQFAWDVFEQFEAMHQNASYPGAYLPTQSRSYASLLNENNFDYMLHYFETLLTLLDVTSGHQHERVRATLERLGDFMVSTLVVAADADSAFVSYWYGSDWGLHPRAYNPAQLWTPSRFATAGHGIEFAWLLSRAVERGFNVDWLDAGRRLLVFARRYGVNPNAGGMLYDRVNTDGSVIDDGQSFVNTVWWPQAETARALAHWSFLRSEDEWGAFDATKSMIESLFIDPVYGAWFESLDITNPSLTTSFWTASPRMNYKGSIWKVNYHVTMYYKELLRLSDLRDPSKAFGFAFTSYERTTMPDETAANGDFDGDGLSNALEYAMGSDARRPSTGSVVSLWNPLLGRIGIRFPVSKTVLNARIVLEESEDLITWSAASPETQIVSDNEQTEYLESWVDVPNGERLFLRLNAEFEPMGSL